MKAGSSFAWFNDKIIVVISLNLVVIVKVGFIDEEEKLLRD